MLKPPALCPGEKVGIVVPSSPVKEPFRTQGLEKIKAMGYVPVEVEDILSKNDFLAKNPGESFNDLQQFFAADEIKAIWSARGGYGSNHLLPMLEKLIIKEPKIIIGASDLSYLLWYLLDHFQMTVFYGPMAYSSLPDNRFNFDNFQAMLSGAYTEIKIPGQVLLPGQTKAIITGGCLSNFVSLIGTPYLPIIRDRILLLEDISERPYRLDRMFWQIVQAGLFSQIKGLILGEFRHCFVDDEEKKHFYRRICDYLHEFHIPIIYDLPFGHSENIHTLPLGIEVEIDTSSFPGLRIKEKGVK
ncbi:MAG: LD-carboxypeptidase [Acidobacteria bacterium]|jgi:muramoyltetrapeptide carboxypeptidase|nr:LD-carboxypeptidase [Acidobacteriota bacterium]